MQLALLYISIFKSGIESSTIMLELGNINQNEALVAQNAALHPVIPACEQVKTIDKFFEAENVNEFYVYVYEPNIIFALYTELSSYQQSRFSYEPSFNTQAVNVAVLVCADNNKLMLDVKQFNYNEIMYSNMQ
ncbi:Hypothetical_protein [Hexamita inflata]|uniref:Hypothetical_protein n=1 Tax=Hexamita inflata TaxID=28002 RepID=A0AA86TUV4_9EUKA|nr:Hypothetical protein HINF_LOCUS17385 [Hexamita inflata]